MDTYFTFTGSVDAKSVGDTINWLNGEFLNGRLTHLRFYLSSTGGDIDAAIRFYDFVKALPVTVDMYAFGQIDSAANMMYLAGTRRVAVAGCRFLFHPELFNTALPKLSLPQQTESIQIFTELHRRHIDIISGASGLSRTDAETLISSCHILTPEEARTKGFVHEIVTSFPPMGQTAIPAPSARTHTQPIHE